MLHTIRARITIAYAVLLMVTLIVLEVGIYQALKWQLYGSMRESVEALAAQAERLDVEGQPGGQTGVAMDIADPSLSETLAKDDFLLEIRGPNGALFSRSAKLKSQTLFPLPAPAKHQNDQLLVRDVPGIGPAMVFVTALRQNGRLLGFIAAGRALREMAAFLAQLRSLLYAGGFLTLAVSLLGGWMLAGAALRPVDDITRAARSVSAGTLSTRLALRRPDDELRRLSSAFNEMLDRLERAFERERQFTADVAHELRTPLTILRGEIDVALRRTRSAQEYQQSLTMLSGEVQRLSLMVADLLLLARADAGTELIREEPVQVDQLLRRIRDRFTDDAAKRGVALHLDGPAGMTIVGDRERLAEAVANLIDNALKHTPESGTIDVRWQQQPDGASIQVVDSGAGISPEHLPNVFKRFYRADNHRSRREGGAGLGLAITKWIVEAHGGTITASSSNGQGTTVAIWLPTRRTRVPVSSVSA